MKKTIIFILTIVFAIVLGWAITCGLIKLITLCFGLKFNLLVATGIWLVLLLLKDVFSNKQ